MMDFRQYPLICREHYSEPSNTKLDFRDDVSVDLIGLKLRDFEYITDYCRKHEIGLSKFIMGALERYLKELRAKEDDVE